MKDRLRIDKRRPGLQADTKERGRIIAIQTHSIVASFGRAKTAAKVHKPSYEIYFSEKKRQASASGAPPIIGRDVVFVIANRRYKGDFGQSGPKIYTHSELEPLDPNEPEPSFDSHTFGTLLHGNFGLATREKVELIFSEIPETAGTTLQVEVRHPKLTMPQSEPIPPPEPAIVDGLLSSAGAGFGDPRNNKLVEDAAINFVKANYKGWAVRDLSTKTTFGYDLECTRGAEIRHIEVKGVSGSLEEFIITRNEVKAAEKDPNFVLAVVTNAQSKKPKLSEYSGGEMLERFDLTPIAFRAKPQKPSK